MVEHEHPQSFMNRQKGFAFAAALVLMAGAVGFLVWLKAHQKLGIPGVNLDLPTQVLDYQSIPMEISDSEKNTLPKDTKFARRLYTCVREAETNQIQLGIVLMGADRTGIHK